LLNVLAEEDPWDWRVLWFLGRLNLAKGDADAERKTLMSDKLQLVALRSTN